MAYGVFTPQVPDQNDLLLGEGLIYYNYGEGSQALIGATRGGSKLQIDRTIRDMPYDGAYGVTKGLRRYEKCIPRLIVSLLKLSYVSLAYGLPCTVTDKGDYHEIAFDLEIVDADYCTNIAFIGQKHDGKACKIFIYNALNDGNINFNFKEKDEVVGDLTYTGHYGTTTPTVPPVEIWDYDV